uniref:Uncharacterized protein n=1 Tax=Anguilla anguilla TaxID=7936 RepID=A0A0E9TXB2_ANGAN
MHVNTPLLNMHAMDRGRVFSVRERGGRANIFGRASGRGPTKA